MPSPGPVSTPGRPPPTPAIPEAPRGAAANPLQDLRHRGAASGRRFAPPLPRHGCKGTPRSPHTRKPLVGVQPQPGALNLFPFLRHSRHCDHERAARWTTPDPGPPASLRPGVEDVPRPALSVFQGLRPLPGSRTGPRTGSRLRRGAPPGPGPRRTSRRRTTGLGRTGPTPRG